MTQFKAKWKQLGSHIHRRMFSRTPPTETWAKNGELVFDRSEWPDALISFECGGFEAEKES